ncbi:hypothetical protein SERLADRAFT_444115 [Serpula lacrymans var. lacrymans S7.9]|uniref:Uncharacterized protein n=1 Tax=Serpula lacrymans var. lacrymans (strain S7.9) TaxID=578457 RepID=F8PEJ3_SERL9|nr:uncharacterized protein SERLADRAFT_444115 [Serpula lacrymans var. lacrymans S7.9]EGO18444.1 hypothetical protein SERLADRAFT_444115 [Serpula lacrymans var. lacrymans S7.9]
MSYIVGGGDFYASHTFETLKLFKFSDALHAHEQQLLIARHNSLATDTEEDAVVDLDDDSPQFNSTILTVKHNEVNMLDGVADYTLRPAEESFSALYLWEFTEWVVKINECKDAQDGMSESLQNNILDSLPFISRNQEDDNDELEEALLVDPLLDSADNNDDDDDYINLQKSDLNVTDPSLHDALEAAKTADQVGLFRSAVSALLCVEIC